MKDRITKIMEIKKLNATKFADELEIQRSGISHILSGRNKPSLDLIIKIKETYPEFRLDWLIFGQGPVTEAAFDVPSTPKRTREPDLFGIDDEILSEKDKKKGIDELSSVERIEEQRAIPKKPEPVLGTSVSADKPEFGLERIVLLYKNGTFKVYEP
jgi:transcriptional regulator with XRE-family HTH domain